MSSRFIKIITISIALLMTGLSFHTVADEALVNAAQQGDLSRVKFLLEQGSQVNSRLSDGTSALHWAVNSEQIEASIALLDAGANAVAKDRYGITPLYLAALNGNASMLSLLLNTDADVNSVSPTGETTLMTAVRTGRLDAIELLLARGANVAARDPEYQQTALMIAVRENHSEVIELLISQGANVNARTRVGPRPDFVPPCKGTGCGSEGVGINRGGLPDRGRRGEAKGGMTSLIYAARDGHLQAASLLINSGVDMEQAEANGIPPLLMALLNDQVDVAELLLNAGANPNVQDSWGRSPLFAAVEYRNLDMNNRAVDDPVHNGINREPYIAIIKLLLNQGAEVNVRTLDVAPSRKWLHSLNDVSWVDFTGQTPFLRAALAGDTRVMNLLLEYGADPNQATFSGSTPLMAASGVNWVVAQTFTESPEALISAVELCLILGADVNATNSMGISAIIGAANRGSNDIIRILVSNGGRLDIVDAEGRSPSRWAEGVFLAAVGAEIKPSTISLIAELSASAITVEP